MQDQPAALRESDVLETLDIVDWDGPFDAGVRQRAAAALEAGRVLFMPRLGFEVAAAERRFLSAEAAGGSRKNVSLDPQLGALQNAATEAGDSAGLAAMVDRFGRQATGLIGALVPAYAAQLQRARTSFRPVEIAGRPGSPRHDDRLLHVDAFPSRPTRGTRILRVFSNVAPDARPRQWAVGEPFAVHAARFLPRLPRPLPGSARLLALLGITKGRRSAYDALMLGLHDAAKLDAAYQDAAPRAALSFPSGSTWAAFTDQVPHAALAGRCALEQTLLLPVAAMLQPARSPLRVLEALAGRTLA